jgi:very-short-patch-repair endonuclease
MTDRFNLIKSSNYHKIKMLFDCLYLSIRKNGRFVTKKLNMPIIYNRKKLKVIRKNLRNKSVFCERLLWWKIRNEQLGVKFRRQFSIGNFVADFYCPKLKLAIEVDGETHSTEKEVRQDYRKKSYLKSLGIRMIRYTNNDIVKSLDDVVENISEKIIEILNSPSP